MQQIDASLPGDEPELLQRRILNQPKDDKTDAKRQVSLSDNGHLYDRDNCFKKSLHYFESELEDRNSLCYLHDTIYVWMCYDIVTARY